MLLSSRSPRAPRQKTLYELHELIVFHIPGGNDDEVRRLEYPTVILLRRGVIECTNCFHSTRDRKTERMRGKVRTTKDLAKELLGRVVGHLQLLDDHALLALHFLLVELRIAEHIGEKVECVFKLVVDHLDRESGFFMRRECFERTAESILLDGDVECGSFLSPFKDSVFDEVSDTVEFIRLVSRTDAEKDSARNGSHAGHSVGEDDKTVFETGFVDVFVHQED